MKKHTEKALDYFNRHQNNECFITSDGRVFHNSGSARSFATTLENDEVEHFTRIEVEKAKRQKQKAESNEPKAKDDTTDEKVKEPKDITEKPEQGIDKLSKNNTTDEKVKELLELELNSKNYQKMVSLVKHFGLTPENNKTENLIAVLTEYKSKLEK